MNQPNPDHTSHDATLIAGHAAGDLMDTDRNRADVLLASCRDCADLHRDLLAIAAATRSLPARAVPARDFRLTPAHAERLRRGSWLRRILRPFAATGSAVRPIAAAFTSLGIAGLLVAAAVPGLFGSATSLAPDRAATTGAGANAAATTAPAFGPSGAPVPQAGATPNVYDYGTNADRSAAPVPVSTGGKAVSTEASGPGAIAIGSAAPTTPGGVAIGGTGTDSGSVSNNASMPFSPAAAPQPPNLLLIGSLALLAIGLVLFGLRLAGRRLRL